MLVTTKNRREITLASCLLVACLPALYGHCEANDRIVEPCVWKDCHRGAVSVSMDDSEVSCTAALKRNNFKGTYFISEFAIIEPEEKRKKRYLILSKLYQEGNEIGGHGAQHIANFSDEKDFKRDFLHNINTIKNKIGVPPVDIISMSWPFGTVQYREFVSQYFLSARGYAINEFEDPTPEDFMNLKCFDSPEHNLAKRLNFHLLLSKVQENGKWAILVFHSICNHHTAIDRLKTKDLWVAPIGTVVKYILQRDRVRIEEVNVDQNKISFSVSRPGLPPSKIRDFERAFKKEDEITLKIDIDDAREIDRVIIAGEQKKHAFIEVDQNKYLLLNTAIPSESNKSVEIFYAMPQN